MELDEVLEMEEFNELDLLYKIIDIAESTTKDAEKVLKGQKEAGICVRDKMQDIKLLCDSIRDKVQIRKGTKWSTKRSNAIVKAIKKIGVFLQKKKTESLAAQMKIWSTIHHIGCQNDHNAFL